MGGWWCETPLLGGPHDTTSSLVVFIVSDGDDRPIERWLHESIPARTVNYKLLKSKEHIGLGAARNLAVNATDAEYITWLDADDLYNTSEAVSFFLSGICILEHNDNVALVYSDNFETDQFLNQGYLRRKLFFNKLHIKYRCKNIDPIYYVDFIYQAQIVRKSDFIEIGGFVENKIGEDVELILKMATYFSRKIFHHLPYSAYIYRYNPEGIVSTKYRELRQINCKTYLLYAKKAKIHQSNNVLFRVLFFDEISGILKYNKLNRVFFNTFLPNDPSFLFYVQRKEFNQ